jgi:hypothetical protein
MDEIYTIMQRLALIESTITPDNVAKGLNAQQRSVPQMPALFKMPKQGPVLGGNPNKKAPSAGYMVGSNESAENDEEALEEAVTSEDKLDRVKKSFAEYLDSIADEKKDTDLKDRVRVDRDLGKHPDKDASIIAKQVVGVAEDPTEENPVVQMPTAPIQNPTYAESAPVKTIALEDGRACEIHGDEARGFEIRHGRRQLPTRFPKLSHADMAVKLFQRRHQQPEQKNQDYLEER